MGNKLTYEEVFEAANDYFKGIELSVLGNEKLFLFFMLGYERGNAKGRLASDGARK